MGVATTSRGGTIARTIEPHASAWAVSIYRGLSTFGEPAIHHPWYTYIEVYRRAFRENRELANYVFLILLNLKVHQVQRAQVWKLYDNIIGVSLSMIRRAQIFALFLADGSKDPKNRRNPVRW
jgi:elongation factor P--beta-lysine ligase